MSETGKQRRNEKGFTLVELMVVVLLTAIAVISIYRGYTAFSQSADAQQQIIEMQQNLRIGMTRLATDMRRAGIDEEDDDVAGFQAGDETSVAFSMDLGSGGVFENDTPIDNDDDGLVDEEDESRIGDGDTTDYGEQIKYSLVYDSGGTITQCPAAYDPTKYPCFLYREVWDPAASGGAGGYVGQKVIENVDALNFVYYDSGSTSPSTPPAPITVGAGGLTATQLAVISRVEITLVVRTTNEDYRYNDNEEYKNLQGATLVDKVGDNFRRRAFNMIVDIRNNI